MTGTTMMPRAPYLPCPMRSVGKRYDTALDVRR